jgi:hypothetical protein
MTAYEWTRIALESGLLLTGGVGVYIAAKQLTSIAESSRHSVRANQNANFMAVIALESALADARKGTVEAAARVAGLGDNPDKQAVEFAGMMLQEAEEQYLNVTDRLCCCIIRGQVDETIYRRDYRPWIAEIVTKFRSELGSDTRHPNILKVHAAWSDDKSAVDLSLGTPS